MIAMFVTDMAKGCWRESPGVTILLCLALAGMACGSGYMAVGEHKKGIGEPGAMKTEAGSFLFGVWCFILLILVMILPIEFVIWIDGLLKSH